MAEATAIASGRLGALAERTLALVFPFVAALLVSGLVLLAVGENPFDVFALMAREAFGSERRIAATLSAATPLLFTAVATAICFRCGVSMSVSRAPSCWPDWQEPSSASLCRPDSVWR